MSTNTKQRFLPFAGVLLAPTPRYHQGEYTLGWATKAALCRWASKPQCCFYETLLGRVKLGHLVLVQPTHTHTHLHAHK